MNRVENQSQLSKRESSNTVQCKECKQKVSMYLAREDGTYICLECADTPYTRVQ